MYGFYKSLQEEVIDRERKANKVVRWSAVLLFLTEESLTCLDGWTKKASEILHRQSVKKCPSRKPDLVIV